MGFFQDAGDFALNKYLKLGLGATSNNPVNQLPVDSNAGRNDSLNNAKYSDATKPLIAQLYPGSDQSYAGVINQGYQLLGQPFHDNTDRSTITAQGTTQLASAYADQVYKQTGQLPSEDEVRNFVAQNYTPTFATQLIQNVVTPDQINNMASQYLQSNPSKAAQPAQQSVTDLSGLADQQYQTGVQNFTNSVQDQYVPQKQGLAEDLASQNMLGQNNSRYSLDTLEANKNKTLSEGLGQLANQRAGAGIGLGVTAAQLGQQAQQFGVNAGLQRQGLMAGINQQTYQNLLGQQGIQTAQQLGQQQAKNNQPGLMDYLNTGAKVASGLGSLIGAFS